MTNHRWILVLIMLGLVCGLTQQSSAQQAPVPTPGVIRINVNLVQVDAVVTDGKGKPVTDLKSEDFEVLQDGKAQKIQNFEFIRVRDPLRNLTVGSQAANPRTRPDLPPVSTTALRPDQIRRTIALVADDLALSFDAIVHVRDALKKWVDNDMQPGDLVSIVRTNAATGALQQFTSDKRLLYAAIDRLKYQPGRIGVESFSPVGAPRLTTDTGFEGELANAYIVGSLNAIRYVMQGLREIPGRKSLILFSEDMTLDIDGPLSRRQSIEDRLRQLTDEANRSSVVFYAIDPRGVIYTGPTVSDNINAILPQEGGIGGQVADMIGRRSQQYIASQDGLVLLAQRTGGVFYADSNDIGSRLREAVDDGDGYYLLGYQPNQDTFEERASGPKFHSISVRLKRPGLNVRSRTGFYGLADARPAPPTPPTRQAQLAKALVSPFTTADLSVRLTTLFSHSEKEGPFIKALLYFDAHDLKFAEEPDGTRSAVIDIAVVTFNENGNPAETVNKTWNLRFPTEVYEETLKKGLVYSVPVPIKKAGPYQLRVALRDANSQKLGSAMQFVDVPNIDNGRLTLSGIVVSAEPPDAESKGTPAVRIFKSGGTITYAYEILNAQTNGQEKPQLEMRLRLYQEGQTVYEGAAVPLKVEGEPNAKRFVAGGRMQLTKIPPGEYVMQINVTDVLRKDRYRSADQAIDFEVQ
jgi:VWFA-related protein